MLAHYLVGVVSFDVFRAFTPGRDETFDIEHTDGVIRDRVDQKLEAMGIGELVDAAGGQGHISALQSNFEHIKGTVDPLPWGISRQEPGMISATASYYNKTPDIMISCSLISYVAAASVPISLHPFAMAQGRNDADDTPPDAGSDRSTAPRDDLPYKVELWNEGRTSVEQVLAVTAHSSIGYAAYHAATREYPDRYVTLRHRNRVLSRWSAQR
jgi:hypothetical protein